MLVRLLLRRHRLWGWIRRLRSTVRFLRRRLRLREANLSISTRRTCRWIASNRRRMWPLPSGFGRWGLVWFHFFFNFTWFLANACKFLARFNCSNWMDGSALGKFGKGKKWRGMQMEKPSSGANTIRPLRMHMVSFLLEADRLVGFRLIFFFAVIGLPVRNFWRCLSAKNYEIQISLLRILKSFIFSEYQNKYQLSRLERKRQFLCFI